MNKKNRVTVTVASLFACMALAAGVFIAQHWHQVKPVDRSQFTGTWLDTPRPVSAFHLTGTDGQPFDNQRLQKQWTWVFFGFTQCGSICPVTMAELGKTYRLLAEQNVKPLPQVVLISLDPERDSLKKLKHYVKAFDPHFIGARGEDDDIQSLTKELGIAYAKVSGAAASDQIQHSGAVMVFNPQGKLAAFFTSPHQAVQLAKDYQLLIQ